MRILICAGEKSGFMLADYLEQEIKNLSGSVEVKWFNVAKETGPIIGIWEGLQTALRKKRLVGRVWQKVKGWGPDRVILIGYPGVNLFLGKRFRQAGIPVIYLAPPQVWAWGRFRVRLLHRAADRVICLFRFEEQFLRNAGIDAVYYGYPFLDRVLLSGSREETLKRIGYNSATEYLAFLPGSRPSEVGYHEPLFVQVFIRLKRRYPELKGVMIGGAEEKLPDGLTRINDGERYGLIGYAVAAVVVSGTATAETAILGIPEVVCYHLSRLSYFLARLLVRVRYFSIPNLVAGEPVVPELIDPSVDDIYYKVCRFVDDDIYRQKVVAGLKRVQRLLGPSGAMGNIAKEVLGFYPGGNG